LPVAPLFSPTMRCYFEPYASKPRVAHHTTSLWSRNYDGSLTDLTHGFGTGRSLQTWVTGPLSTSDYKMENHTTFVFRRV
jgi:hypothetical protein